MTTVSRCSRKLNYKSMGRNYHPPNSLRRLRRLFQPRFSSHSVQRRHFRSEVWIRNRSSAMFFSAQELHVCRRQIEFLKPFRFQNKP